MQLQFTTCECGCGGFLKSHNRFLRGHWRKTLSILTNFLSKLMICSTGCWTLNLRKRTDGYLALKNHGQPIRAHRFSYEWFVGKIPMGLLVCHHCDNPRCVNPDHLFIGTDADNARDAAKKGRNSMVLHPEKVSRGEARWNAKLSNMKCLEIRQRYVMSAVSQKELAQEYGVSPSAICRLLKGQTWYHVSVY